MSNTHGVSSVIVVSANTVSSFIVEAASAQPPIKAVPYTGQWQRPRVLAAPAESTRRWGMWWNINEEDSRWRLEIREKLPVCTVELTYKLILNYSLVQWPFVFESRCVRFRLSR